MYGNTFPIRWSEKKIILDTAYEFEDYANSCALAIADDQMSRAGHLDRHLNDLPEFVDLQLDRTREHVTVEACGILKELDHSISQIYDSIEWEKHREPGEMDYTDATATAGLVSFKAAEKLRKIYRLPKRDMPFGDSTIAEFLEENVKVRP